MRINFFSPLLIVLFFISACGQGSEKIYFKINSDRKILVPILFNDSIKADMIFDTGFMDYNLIVDSTFHSKYLNIRSKYNKNASSIGIGWSNDSSSSILYSTPQIIKMGNTYIQFDTVHITNWRRLLLESGDGLFTLPTADRENIWELNFQSNYLQIHPEGTFTLPSNCYIFPMYKSIPYMVELPLHIRYRDLDTITINGPYIIDTGAPWDLILKAPSKEFDFFNAKKDPTWLKYSDWYCLRYNAKMDFSNHLSFDSVRVYTFNYPLQTGYFLGLNFLKRFNIFFDLKNRVIGFQPIKNYKRLIDSSWKRFHYAVEKKEKNKVKVKKVANYDENYYKAAGLLEGDEIVAINNKPYKTLSREDKAAFLKTDKLILSIIRRGKKLNLTVIVNRNEEQGD